MGIDGYISMMADIRLFFVPSYVFLKHQTVISILPYLVRSMINFERKMNGMPHTIDDCYLQIENFTCINLRIFLINPTLLTSILKLLCTDFTTRSMSYIIDQYNLRERYKI